MLWSITCGYPHIIEMLGKAFRVGLYIRLIASTIYVIVWLIDYHFVIPDFAEKYSAHILENLKACGASEEVMAKKSAEMVSFSKMYKNPFFNALMTYSEILPVGLIVSLISGWTLKKKRTTRTRFLNLWLNQNVVNY